MAPSSDSNAALAAAGLPGANAEAAPWARYRDNFARHLIGISRDLQTRVMRRLGEEHGYGGLRPSFAALLSLVSIEGRPLTALAAQLAISKQACSQLAKLAEREGYLERQPDPQDGRAKLVMLSPRGRALVADAVQIILDSESEYASLVGAAAYQRFTASLARLFAGLGIPAHSEPNLKASASRSVGVLPLIAVRMQQDLMQATMARGHAGLKMSHGEVLPLIGPSGARIHELARIHGVSRQAISATSRDLEKLGYLRRENDPDDRRGVVLRLSNRGEALIGDSVAALDGVEAAFVGVLGATRLATLERVARALYRELHLEDEIFADEPRDARQRAGSEASDASAKALENKTTRDIRGLATSLRRELGSRDAARLAALLEPRERRTET